MGIGPEVTARALRARQSPWPVVLLGREAPMRAQARAAGLVLPVVARIEDVPAGAVGLLVTHDGAEPAEVAAIRTAAQACLAGRAAALVTGPIHKGRLAARGFAFKGHTDFLGHLCGAGEPVMAFAGGSLRVALVTTHIPLMEVGAALTEARIARVVTVAHAALRDDLGLPAPRLVVCGLNPHAGEGGLLGREELEVIGPACEMLRAAGLAVIGPVSAETAFLEARLGRVEMIVAMYHDQGLAPLKAVDFGRSVNCTLGLPIIRTSVDHGTADSLVGTGQADPASMGAALRLAEAVVRRRLRRTDPPAR